MKKFISKNGLSRRLGLALQTVDARISDRQVQPDAVQLQAGGRPVWLFDVDNLPALRLKLGNPTPRQ